MKVTIVAGARPNFIKVSPIIKAIQSAQRKQKLISFRLVHTGQHYDKKMSSDFFDQLGIPHPNINLGCGGGSQAEQGAAIMVGFEKELIDNRPDVVLVVGDVTSTMACTITAKKLCIDVAHVEAGIRSGDMTMPEEINRIVTDSICDHFFTTTETANKHLQKSGIDDSKIHLVGNTMIDTLHQNLSKIKKPDLWDKHQLNKKQYFLATIHRPSNVDNPEKLNSILSAIKASSLNFPIVFPVHPRTRQIIDRFKINMENILMIEPQSYLEFIFLIQYSKGVITDSGGITEEATILDVPCLTLRNSTERPETVSLGTNELIGDNLSKMKYCIERIIAGNWKRGRVPPFWDGKSSERIIDTLTLIYANLSAKTEPNHNVSS
ncbi:non-hydrolyzing UDP-N-acetylglucosamine 2-epimerase [Segetibacter aerophilus]|uniref:UDP-N-acetyl glucosamine 2-epimerase n=1 Tax=Segetibacter aerophilus TaxID=670293 RepID=A0A512BH08_9BACT|nr:UDP-N-acetylglucosamine 2-epimerase (non-hydrolyzing) [Segetibacter aerophilus]GEO11248.1 UDP-N-acetyl glucosamine 2-epimerase [Segetibacter aerophilus]